MYITVNGSTEAMVNHTESLIAIYYSQYRLPPSYLCLIDWNWTLWLHLVQTLKQCLTPMKQFFFKNSEFPFGHRIWVIFHCPNSSLSACQGWCQRWRHPLAQDGFGRALPRHPKMLSHLTCSTLSCLGAHSSLFSASCLQMSPGYPSLLHQLVHALVERISDQKMMIESFLHHNSNHKYQITDTLLFLHFLFCMLYAYNHHCWVQCSIETE